MSAFEIGSVLLGFLIIAVTVWQIVKRGVSPSNGRFDDHWPSGG